MQTPYQPALSGGVDVNEVSRPNVDFGLDLQLPALPPRGIEGDHCRVLFACKVCNAVFNSFFALKMHKAKHAAFRSASGRRVSLMLFVCLFELFF